MKKLIFAFMVMLGMGLTSCGSKANTETTNCSCDSVCVCDSICECDTVLIADTVEVEDSVL